MAPAQTMEIQMVFCSNTVTDINTDPCFSRTWDPDMALGNSVTWTSPWTQVAVHTTYTKMAPGGSVAMDINMASGCSTEHGYPYGLGW